jgi:hypothetical protein
MVSKWNLFWDGDKQAFPDEHGKNDARNDKAPVTHTVDMMDRIFGGADEVRANEERYLKSYDEEKQKIREEQNNDYLRQIAENSKR